MVINACGWVWSCSCLYVSSHAGLRKLTSTLFSHHCKCFCTCVHVCISTHACICMNVCCMYACICVCMHMCMCVCMHMCMHVWSSISFLCQVCQVPRSGESDPPLPGERGWRNDANSFHRAQGGGNQGKLFFNNPNGKKKKVKKKWSEFHALFYFRVLSFRFSGFRCHV